MFSQLSDHSTHLLNKKSTFKEDSYILYRGGMVSSNLIDIEVIMKNYPEINSKIIIDAKDDKDVLEMRIVEIVEKFPKLSGLSELFARDLCLKTERGLVPISEKNLESFIKAKDEIYFNLEFSEIWLDIEMSLQSEENNLKINFEMKVKVDYYISELKHVLIKMGILSWAKYIFDEEDFENSDHYLFSYFSTKFPDSDGNLKSYTDIELENFHEKVRDRFSFNSKISCSIDFINFNEIIYKDFNKLIEEKNDKAGRLNKFDFNRKKVMKKFITQYLHKFCRHDVKNSHVAKHKNVIWKWNDESAKIRRVSSAYNVRIDEESRRDSFIDDTFSYCNSHMMESRSYFNLYDTMNYAPNNGGDLMGSNSNLNNRIHEKFDSKYSQDFCLLQTIDCFKLINEHSGSFFSNLEFECVYLPDTKNLKKISRENSELIRKSFKIKRNSSESDFFYESKNNFISHFKFCRKKNTHIFILAIFVFILFIWLMY